MWLHLENVCCTRGNGDRSFTVEVPQLRVCAGELLAVTGRNGSGKSTLLEILGLLLRPTANRRFHWQIEPAGETVDVGGLWRDQAQAQLARLRSRCIGFILQNGGLLPFLNVRDNIALPRQLAGRPGWAPPVAALVERLDIGPLLARKPRELSIGERQRVAVVRALAHDPPLLLADEPTSALDADREKRVLDLLVERMERPGRIGIIVTHDQDWIRRAGLPQIRLLQQPGGGSHFSTDVGGT